MPWDQPSTDCPEYVAWTNGKYVSLTPWIKLDNTTISLAVNILNSSPKRRYNLKEIKEHRWMINKLKKKGMYEKRNNFNQIKSIL